MNLLFIPGKEVKFSVFKKIKEGQARGSVKSGLGTVWIAPSMKSLSELRGWVSEIAHFSRVRDVYVLDIRGFSDEWFSVLLKSLELAASGDFWLLADSLGSVPLTIRSRCAVVQEGALDSEKEIEAAKELEVEVTAIVEAMGKDATVVSALLPVIATLSGDDGYTVETATKMAVMRPTFVDFLYMLDVSSLSSFATLQSFSDKLKGMPAVFLMVEWLKDEGSIFSEKEQKVCVFLRKPEFKRLLIHHLHPDAVVDFFIPFVVTYKFMGAVNR